MYFRDFYSNQVYLTFDKQNLKEKADQVFIITRTQGYWVLTEHRERGFEFPGGKVEIGETEREAATREVYEETGGVASDLKLIGQYCVDTRYKKVIKNIYFAELDKFDPIEPTSEIAGVVILSDLPIRIKNRNDFSFNMKDDVLTETLKEIKKQKLV